MLEFCHFLKASEATAASGVTSDLRCYLFWPYDLGSELYGLIYPCFHASLASIHKMFHKMLTPLPPHPLDCGRVSH